MTPLKEEIEYFNGNIYIHPCITSEIRKQLRKIMRKNKFLILISFVEY